VRAGTNSCEEYDPQEELDALHQADQREGVGMGAIVWPIIMAVVVGLIVFAVMLVRGM
jgi:hypothetical protein